MMMCMCNHAISLSWFEGVESRGGVSRPRGVADSFGAPVGSKPICTVPNIYVAEVHGV